MGVQQWSDNIILVNLSQEHETSDDLETVAEKVLERNDYHVVIDFSDVDTVTSSDLSKLLKLHEPLNEEGHRLILCGLAATIQGILAVANLDTLFEIVDDKFTALANLEMLG